MFRNLNNLYLSIGSFFGAVGSYFLWFVTNYNVMGVLGFIAIVVSIVAGVLTIVEKRMSIRFMRNKNGGHW